MALITMPTGGLRSVSWGLPRHPSYMVRSGWTGKQQLVDIGATQGFTAQVEVAPGTVLQSNAWRAFFAKLKGITNEFLLPAVGRPQSATDFGFVNGGGQVGSSLSIGGLPPSQTVLPEGAMIAAGVSVTPGVQRMYVLTAPLVSNGSGIGVASIEPAIAVAHANTAAVRIGTPAALMRLASPETGWSIEPGGIIRPFAFQCEECI